MEMMTVYYNLTVCRQEDSFPNAKTRTIHLTNLNKICRAVDEIYVITRLRFVVISWKISLHYF